MKPARACVFGCEGPQLTAWERQFYADADPWGFILFARNVVEPDQLRALTSDLRSSVGRNAPVFIDQEGGRVGRLRSPHWQEWEPPLDELGAVGIDEAKRLVRRRYAHIAKELRDIGIDGNCVPVLDIAFDHTHHILRNRCLGDEPNRIAILGRIAAETLLDAGIIPVIKHMPGQGRAHQDSHLELPVVDADFETLSATDFVPFKQLSDMPVGITAHVLYLSIDADSCGTLSPRVHELIRKEIGFSGLLMTDDLSMQALGAGPAKAAKAAIEAGCDIALHCNGNREEMTGVAEAVPLLDDQGMARAARALRARDHRTASGAPSDVDASTTERIAEASHG